MLPTWLCFALCRCSQFTCNALSISVEVQTCRRKLWNRWTPGSARHISPGSMAGPGQRSSPILPQPTSWLQALAGSRGSGPQQLWELISSTTGAGSHHSHPKSYSRCHTDENTMTRLDREGGENNQRDAHGKSLQHQQWCMNRSQLETWTNACRKADKHFNTAANKG